MTQRPPLQPGIPYEDEMRRQRSELWTPAAAPRWRERRRAAVEWLVAWREADESLRERTEARIRRDELRLAATVHPE